MTDIHLFGPPLSTPTEGYEIRGELEDTFVAMSAAGRPTLLVPLQPGRIPPGRIEGKMRLSFHGEVDFHWKDRSWRQPAAALECLEAELVSTFEGTCRDLASRVSVPAQANEVAVVVAGWGRLLRGTKLLSSTEQLGLWGELTLLLRLPDADRAAKAWRGPERDGRGSVDFFNGGVALECKTSFKKLQHRISQRQIDYEAPEVETFIVSIFATTDDIDGTTLPEKIADVMQVLEDPTEFSRRLTKAGYSSQYADQYETRFRRLGEPLLIATEDVPRVRTADDGVYDIKYTADLSGAPTVTSHEAERVFSKICFGADHE